MDVKAFDIKLFEFYAFHGAGLAWFVSRSGNLLLLSTIWAMVYKPTFRRKGVRLTADGMLQANETSTRFLPDECERVDVAAIDYVSIPVDKLRRSIDFYAQNFGFLVVEDASGEDDPCVLMRGSGDLYLAIHERRRERTQAGEATRRWSFVVNDLDRVRETVWNLGLAVKDNRDEPTRIHRWRKNKSFLVRDPDGHEIELVERSRF